VRFLSQTFQATERRRVGWFTNTELERDWKETSYFNNRGTFQYWQY